MLVHTVRRMAAACACVAALAACSGNDDPVDRAGAGTGSAGSTGSTGSATPSAGTSGATSAAPSATAEPTATATRGPAGTTTAAPTARRSPGPPARGTSGPPVAVSPLPPAPLGKDATVTSGIAITMTRVQDVQVPAAGPGEVAGPGVAVTIRVRNSSTAAFDLSGLAVVASYGRNTPAEPSGSAKETPLRGSLTRGRSAEGTYYFLVPAGQSRSLRVEVSSSSTASIAVFER